MERDAETIVNDLILHLERAVHDLRSLQDLEPGVVGAEIASETVGLATTAVADAQEAVKASPGLAALIATEPELKRRLVAIRGQFMAVTDPLIF